MKKCRPKRERERARERVTTGGWGKQHNQRLYNLYKSYVREYVQGLSDKGDSMSWECVADGEMKEL
jgi:hypothetical protein